MVFMTILAGNLDDLYGTNSVLSLSLSIYLGCWQATLTCYYLMMKRKAGLEKVVEHVSCFRIFELITI